MLTLFAADADPSESDIVDMLADTTSFRVKKSSETKTQPRAVPSIPEGNGDVSFATLVTSPNSMDEIAALIDSADSHVELEYASLPPEWTKPKKHRSPIVDALIRAARRDVHVRVLLNDDSVFASKERPEEEDEDKPAVAKVYANEVTVKLLNTVAKAEGVPLEGRIVDTKAADITYIHNKGILVDGKRAFVSSINGTQNSVTNNREVALILDSPSAAAYYQKAFDFDWKVSFKKHFDLRVAGLNIQNWLVELSQ
jgi:phosphatidylserine/phosphatidylglycerophosphate/cardiolipin synthase-like enzyme